MDKVSSIRRKAYISFTALLAAFLVSVVASLNTAALSNVGPDPASHGNRSPMYTLEIKPEIRVTNVNAPIYLPQYPSGNVAVEVFDFKYPFGQLGNHLTSTINNAPLTGNMTLWIAPSSFTYDAETGYYKTTVSAVGSGGNSNSYRNATAFRLRVNYPGALIGTGGEQRYSTASGSYFSGSTTRFDSYAIEFAAPCNLTSNVVRTIQLEDLDSGHEDNKYGRITVRVQDMTTGAVWSPYMTGGMGNGQTASVHVNFEPGHKYRLLLDNVESNNTLVYTFPFDNISYVIPCKWDVNAQSYIKNALHGQDAGWQQPNPEDRNAFIASPGDSLNFKHDIRAAGRISSNIGYTVAGGAYYWPAPSGGRTLAGYAVRVNSTVSAPIDDGSLFLRIGNYPGGSYGGEATRNLTEGDLDRQICQRIEWSPQSSNGGIGETPFRCAWVPYHYRLTPSITKDRSEAASGDLVRVSANMNNTGRTRSLNAGWQLSYFVVNAGSGVPAVVASSPGSQPACAPFGSSCTTVAFENGGATSGSQVFGASSNTELANNGQFRLGDYPVGTTICYVLSVRPADVRENLPSRDITGSRDTWAHARDCLVISKKPLVQVLGNDLIVGRGKSITEGSSIATSVKRSGQAYGSWAEYGILPSGLVSGMGSASGYAGTNVDSNVQLCGVSFLTISNASNTNSCSPTNVGRYSFSQPTPFIESRFPKSGAEVIAGSRSIDSFVGGRTYAANSAITLTGPSGELPAGKWFVINASGADVRIESNIMYPENSELESISEIPQVIIIARNITVAESVTQVDAWLVASGTGTNGTLNTCGGVTQASVSTLNAGVCSEQLTFNGPVIANRVLLYRTAGAGAGPASGDPGEIFNLRPDAYMWASAQQAGRGKARTVMTTELPPRF